MVKRCWALCRRFAASLGLILVLRMMIPEPERLERVPDWNLG